MPFRNLHGAVILWLLTHAVHHPGKLQGWNCFHSQHDEQEVLHIYFSSLSVQATTHNWKINKEFVAKKIEIKGGPELMHSKSI